ncbi:phosphonate degradation HD-domain oxygenase [Bordetella sp. FB-8]|uniref:phosphonate degradation HD-domain oxygenase n=1 Tax=Bordetella sp. FB-8 TaxID=1159870 RepID=UPI000363814B|nr:phosphonate degradation HD-domain oxygenase [Bordetella sp. FB-8]
MNEVIDMQDQAITLDRIKALFDGYGTAFYGSEDVTQTQHALQCAHLAEQAGEEPALIAAALLHDLGHLLQASSQTQDMRHQEVGASALATLMGPEVTEPIRLHVAAKRYLCAVDAAYYDTLSQASKNSLALQGGSFDDAGAEAFIAQPHAEAALRLRRYDDLAKDVQAATPPLSHYLPMVERLRRA